MSSEEGRYSKVSRRMWNDERFLALSAPKPNAQTLFQRLLTGPELTCIPGLFQAWDAGIAQALGWPLAGMQKALKELLKVGLVRRDERTGLFWIRNAIRHNEPASPNVIKSWGVAWKELPECKLREEAQARLTEWAESKGPAWAEALANAFGNPSAKSSGKALTKSSGAPSRNQEQEQEQDQEQESPPETPRTSRPSLNNLEASLAYPVQERAQKLLENETYWTFCSPQKWPEVVESASAFSEIIFNRADPKLGGPNDRGTKRFVELLATFTVEELRTAAARAAHDQWFREKIRGFKSLSDEVIRRLLAAKPADGAARPSADPEAAAEIVRRRKEALERRDEADRARVEARAAELDAAAGRAQLTATTRELLEGVGG